MGSEMCIRDRALLARQIIDAKFAQMSREDRDLELRHGSGICAMIGGAPFLMATLADELAKASIYALFAFSTRESVEQVQPDGSVRKTAVFRHQGFVPAISDMGDEDEEEILWPASEAHIRAIPLGELKPTSAKSVRGLHSQWVTESGYDVSSLEISEDGTVGEWSVQGLLSIGKDTDICAVEVDGVVYASYSIN